MNNEDATSPSPDGPSETTNNPEFDPRLTTGNNLLWVLLTKELHRLEDVIKNERKTRLKEWTSNPAVLVVLGFVFTGLVGNLLTAYLTYRQHQRAAERSFFDESNKQRVQKIGEVWEQLDLDQHTIDQLLEPDHEISKEFPNPDARAEEIKRIVRGDRALVSQYRFWLGQRISDRINNYLNANIRYSIRKLAGTSEAELKEDKAARDAAKSDVDQTREELLQGIPR